MSRRVSKTGRVYTEGSQTTRGHYPPTCSGCGGRVVVSGEDPLRFETAEDGIARSWHVACYPQKGDHD